MVATATQSPPKQELQTGPFDMPAIAFEVNMAQIAELEKKYLPLVITDVNDREQVAAVHEARMNCVKLRRGVEKFGKAMRDDATKFAKDVIAAERKLTGPISKVESHLETEEAKVKAEEDRKKREAEEHRQKMIRSRLEMLSAQSFTGSRQFTAADVENLTPQQWGTTLDEARSLKAAHDEGERERKAEQDRIAEANRIESERLQRERDRNDLITLRVQALARLGEVFAPASDLGDMNQDQWTDLLTSAVVRKRERDDAAKAEQERLDKQKADQEAAQAEIDAEKVRVTNVTKTLLMNQRLTRLGDIKTPCGGVELRQILFDAADIPRTGAETAELSDEEFAAMEAKLVDLVQKHEHQLREQAEAEERERIAAQERKDAEAKAAAEAEAAKLAELEKLRPDRDKLENFLADLAELKVPEVSEAAASTAKKMQAAIADAVADMQIYIDQFVAGN